MKIKKNKYDSVLLMSGGMDSTVLYYYLQNKNKKILPLFLNYGQIFLKTEYSRLQRLLPKKQEIIVLRFSDVFKYSDSILIKKANLFSDNITSKSLDLPFRNMLFLSCAVAFANTLNIKNVYAAFINSNHAKEIDCTLKYFNVLKKLYKEVNATKIILPFSSYSKEKVASLGIKLGIPIYDTFSCQVNPNNHCGACPNCVDRLNAFKKLLK